MSQNNSPWNCDNAALFVVACMRVLMRVCEAPSRPYFISTSHTEAAKAETKNQDEYDLVFGQCLLNLLLKDGLATSEDVDHNALWISAHSVLPAAPPYSNPAPAPIVATEQQPSPKQEAPPKDPNDRSNWTVEQWEAEGVKFKPAAATIKSDGVSILQRPVEMPHEGLLRPRQMSRARPIEQIADQLAETYPWGAGAVPVAKWAWDAAGLPGKPNITRQIEISRILTVLYHAGVIQENALIPVGMGTKKNIRTPGRNPGRPKKKK